MGYRRVLGHRLANSATNGKTPRVGAFWGQRWPRGVTSPRDVLQAGSTQIRHVCLPAIAWLHSWGTQGHRVPHRRPNNRETTRHQSWHPHRLGHVDGKEHNGQGLHRDKSWLGLLRFHHKLATFGFDKARGLAFEVDLAQDRAVQSRGRGFAVGTRPQPLGGHRFDHLLRVHPLARFRLEMVKAFDSAKPMILGALLDAVATALRELPHLELPDLPRLADFAQWVSAAETAWGWHKGNFLSAYQGNRRSAHELALECSPIAKPMLELLADHGE